MKRFIVLLMVFVFISAIVVVPGLAEDEVFFKTKIETVSETVKVNEEFKIKLSVYDITSANGFAGLDFILEYDTTAFSLVTKQENDKTVIGTVSYPSAWKGEKHAFEADDEEGKLTLRYLNIAKQGNGFKDDDFSVELTFKCLKKTDDQQIKLTSATGAEDANENTLYDAKGGTASLKIDIEGGSISTTTIIIIIAALVAVVIILLVIFLIKKKNSKA